MAHTHEKISTPAVTINILPDDIFREIFAFCLSDISSYGSNSHWHMAGWKRLVQVCQLWRQIIYGSPQYLDLHISCSVAVPFRKNLNCWPEFPLSLCYSICPNKDEEVNDLIAALEHRNRVHHLNLHIGSWDSESRVYEVLEKMQVSFPVLTDLELEGPDMDHEAEVYDISNKFLGNTAPCLQYLRLAGISFQRLPELLLSASGLVSLQLDDIPEYGCISPEAMVGGLAGLTSLRTLCIEFRSLDELSDEVLEEERHLDPPMRPVLPALAEFVFRGESKYLEDLVARIDMPSVEDIKIEYFRVPPWSNVPQHSQFIDRTAGLELAQFRHAQVIFGHMHSQIQLDRPQGERHQLHFSLGGEIIVSDTCRGSDLDLLVPRMTRVLGQLTALLSNVGHLSLDTYTYWPEEINHLDNSKLLPLLHLFPTVEELRVSLPLVATIKTVLENIAEERIAEVMPALRSLQLGDGNHEPVEPPERFLSFRDLSGHPVTIVNINTQDQVGPSEE